jgi:hypothetical protein
MTETFLFSDSHEEYGSEFLSVHPTERSLVIVIKEYQSRITDKDLVSVPEILAEARGQNGRYPTNVHPFGWGGASVFILTEVTKEEE